MISSQQPSTPQIAATSKQTSDEYAREKLQLPNREINEKSKSLTTLNNWKFLGESKHTNMVDDASHFVVELKQKVPTRSYSQC